MIGNFWRCLRIGFVLSREGVFDLVDPELLSPSGRFLMRTASLVRRRGARDKSPLSVALVRLGPSYVKFGQFLATRPDLIGEKLADDLASLQDKMPPFPRADAEARIEKIFSKKPHELFLEFSDPVAAASVAQVHKASVILSPGSEPLVVAVKVLRPGIHKTFDRDVSAMRFAARCIDFFVPKARRLRSRDVVETLAWSVAFEMDLRLEAAALAELAEKAQGPEDFRVPKVEWSLTAHDVLTTHWVNGIPLSDRGAVMASPFSKKDIATQLIQGFLTQALRDGFFHADMHPGNIFLNSQGRLVLVDAGIMGRLDDRERRILAEILYGFITGNYMRSAEVHFEAGYVPAHHNVALFAQALRAIGTPIHERTAKEISMAHLLSQLFEVSALFDMETRPELVLLQKTMVVVEGVARSFYPELNMWTTAEPVVRSWIEENLGPKAQLNTAKKSFGAAIDLFLRLPALIADAERVFEALGQKNQTSTDKRRMF
jgi:ubiquinone biosynthesis protein